MGGQQSTRRLTVVNDEAAGVIKISDSVVERIQTELEQGKAAAAKKAEQPPPVTEPPPPPPPPTVPSPPTPPKEPPTSPPEVEVPPTPAPAPPPPPPPSPPVVQPTVVQPKPVIQYVEKEPSLSSLRIKAEKEKELAEAESYWRKRFAKQEREHTALTHLEVSAMNSTAEKLSKAFAVEKCPPVCQEVRATLVDCYKQNPQKPLLCSETVKKFSQCVRSTRMASG